MRSRSIGRECWKQMAKPSRWTAEKRYQIVKEAGGRVDSNRSFAGNGIGIVSSMAILAACGAFIGDYGLRN